MKKSLILIALALLAGCRPDEPIAPVPDEDINLGGATSVEGSFIKLFQQPAANLNTAESEQHFQADAVFGAIFVTAPSVVQSGLGPVFNQSSCENCHLGNGRSPFPTSSSDLKGLLFRLSLPGEGIHGEPLPVPGFGGQLQTRGTFGIQPEAQVSIAWQEKVKQYVDGASITLKSPVFTFVNPYTPIPNGMLSSPRMAPPVIGMGLLEAIPETAILALADENDSNNDGISGKPNYVWDVLKQQSRLGRFGWKAGQPDVHQQSAAAYSGDMGITSPLFPIESSWGQPQHDGLDDESEIDQATLDLATFYTQSLGVPKRRNWEDVTVQKGKKLFTELKCTSCHQPKFVTGPHEYGFLSNQTVFPYSDLLLHDMGPELADNRPDFRANGQEWRTPPLWGIGLTQQVGGHSQFLHDGRAGSLEEAIMWHGGEGENSKEAFRTLSAGDRAAVIAFLNSL